MQTETVSTLIAGSRDEGEEIIATGEMELFTSTDTELGYEDMGQQIIGMRWLDLDIPQGATITNAYIKFKAGETDSAATNITFHAEDVDSALMFSSANYDVSSRVLTDNSVTWNNVEAWETGNYYETPDLSSVIQEVIDRGGWNQGASDLVIIATGSSGAARVADSFDGGGRPPELVIEYAVAGSVTTLNGQDGLDDMYGSAGTDHFVFEAASAFNDVDRINNFDTSHDDAIDISDVLSGLDAGTDDISQWVQITDNGIDSTLAIDANGAAGGVNFTAVATIVGVTGLTDEAALLNNGNLIV